MRGSHTEKLYREGDTDGLSMAAAHGWVLTDDRSGHSAQSLGLAQALDHPFERKILRYNALGKLPNFLLGSTAAHLDAHSRAVIAPPWPAFVIAAGRRLAPVMRHIKAQSPQTVLIQLMWPGRLRPFDHIILPQHDHAPDDPRIIRTVGALHGLTPAKIEEAATALDTEYATLPTPRIAVLIGGEVQKEEIARLADLSELLAAGGSLILTTSRRTPGYVARLLKKRLTCPYALYEWGAKAANPYPGLLALADAVVVTGDSISMTSEACITGKPVFVFEAAHFASPKHRRFLDVLYAQNYAKPLTPESSVADRPEMALDETRKVADSLRLHLK